MTSLKQIKTIPEHQCYWFLGLRLWGRGSGQVGGATPFPQAIPPLGSLPPLPGGGLGRATVVGGRNPCTWEDTTGWKGVFWASIVTPDPTPLGCPLHSCWWVTAAGLDASSPVGWSKRSPSELAGTINTLFKFGLHPFLQTQEIFNTSHCPFALGLVQQGLLLSATYFGGILVKSSSDSQVRRSNQQQEKHSSSMELTDRGEPNHVPN